MSRGWSNIIKDQKTHTDSIVTSLRRASRHLKLLICTWRKTELGTGKAKVTQSTECPEQLTVHLRLLRGGFRNFLDTRWNFAPPSSQLRLIWNRLNNQLRAARRHAHFAQKTSLGEEWRTKGKRWEVRLSGMKKNAHTCRCPGFCSCTAIKIKLLNKLVVFILVFNKNIYELFPFNIEIQFNKNQISEGLIIKIKQ